MVDCDVLQADGGTRTASICGGYVALHDALSRLVRLGRLPAHPLREPCAAISVGLVDDVPLLDLAYTEDSRAEVDMNVVMTGSGSLRGGAGDGRGSAVQPGPSSTRWWTWPRRASREIVGGAGGGAGRRRRRPA